MVATSNASNEGRVAEVWAPETGESTDEIVRIVMAIAI
jgi:hypothetical protein